MTPGDRRSIRILHVLYTMSVGGIQTWLMHILRHIDRDRFRMDFLVHHINPCSYTDEIRALGSQIIQCPHPRQHLLQPWVYDRRFKQILHKYGPYDIVHSHTADFNGYVLRLAQQASISVRIAHSHDDTSSCQAKARFYRRLYLILMKWWIAQHATIGLGVSRKAVAYLFGSSWKTDPRWQILPCGTDLAGFREPIDCAAVRAEFGIPADAFTIGHVGRLVEQKNPLFLLEIAAEVLKREPRMHLLLVGDGSLRSRLEAKVRQEGLSDRVIFAGVRSDVPRLMRGAMDVFLFPSLHEGLGLALIEAQAAGLPCVLSDIVPEEADVVKPLVQRISLSQSASAWAEAVVAARGKASAITPADALAVVENSPFNIEMSVKKLVEVYEANFSIC